MGGWDGGGGERERGICIHRPSPHLVQESQGHDHRHRDVQSPSPVSNVEQRPEYHEGASGQVDEFATNFRHVVPDTQVTAEFEHDLDVEDR